MTKGGEFSFFSQTQNYPPPPTEICSLRLEKNIRIYVYINWGGEKGEKSERKQNKEDKREKKWKVKSKVCSGREKT
jgi:hypothetical protein